MNLLVGVVIGIILIVGGTVLSIMISSLTCKKISISDSIPEGMAWAIPIWLVYVLLNLEYTSSYVLPIFSEPMKYFSNETTFLGQVYAMLLITCVLTTRMFHTTDVAICVKTKDELKQFGNDLTKSMQKKKDEVTK